MKHNHFSHWTRSPAHARRRGGALAMMTLMVLVMSGMSYVLVATSLAGHREQRHERESLHARYVCQAGLSESMYHLQRGESGAVGTSGAPITWGNAHYYVTQTDLASDLFSLKATGLDDHTGTRMELVVRQIPNTIWRFGAFGRDFLHMDSNARVDSYNSDLGTYATQATNGSGSSAYAHSNGDVGSDGDVTLDQNSKIWGDASSGPSHSTTVLGNAIVSGSIASLTDPINLPALNVPSYANQGSLTVSSNTTILSGNRTYTNLTVNSNKALTIVGPANIVVTNLMLKSGASFTANTAAGPVTLWVIDDFIMNSNSFMGPSDLKSKNLQVNLLSDNVINPEVTIDLDEIDFNSNSKLYGTLYAPNAAVQIRSNFELFGSMIARSVDLSSNASFHFDEALLTATASGAPTFETVCLRDLPYKGN